MRHLPINVMCKYCDSHTVVAAKKQKLNYRPVLNKHECQRKLKRKFN